MSRATRLEMVRRDHDDRLRRAWESLLGTEQGRMIMFDLLHRTGINASIFTADAATISYLEGRRSIGIDLQNVYLAPQGARVHAEMLLEAESRAEELEIAARQDPEENDHDEGMNDED